MMDMQQIREYGMGFMGDHMRPVWEQATSQEQPSWMLPALVRDCIGEGTWEDENIMMSVIAALGCMQLSIIIVDDMLDHDERGLHKRVGAGQAANIAAGFQSAAMKMVVGTTPQDVLAEMGLLISKGQYMDTTNDRLDEPIYWGIVMDKSCAYYEACFDLGVWLGGWHMPGMKEVGRILGKMIQVTDDLVDIMATPAKPDWWLCNNLAIFYMHQAASQDEWLHFNMLTDVIRRGGEEAPIALRKAQAELIKQGVLAYGLYLLETMRDEAFGLLAQAKLNDQAKIRELFERQVLAVSQLV